MLHKPLILGSIILIFPLSTTYAVDSGITPSGYSGALSTPNATSLATGDIALAYANSIDAHTHRQDFTDHNYLIGIGLLPNVEIFGRLADRSYNNYDFSSGDLRDLSASIKLTIPDMPWLVRFPHPALKPHLAIGATDIGGAAQNFRSYYGVSSWQYQMFGLNLGYAETHHSTDNKTRVDGLFGSFIIQPTDWLQGIAEYDGQDTQIGMRVISPQGSLPLNFRIAADIRYDFSNEDNKQPIWGFNIQRPLAFIADRPQISSHTQSPTTQILPVVISPLKVENTSTSPLNAADNLKELLKKQGFQDIQLGKEQNTLVISIENQSYLWNELDAIGVILAAFYRTSLDVENVKIIINKQKIPVIMVSSQRSCLATWDQAIQNKCKAPILHHLYFTPQQISAATIQTQWENHITQPSSLRPRIGLSPVLNYTLGTEYGAFDYSAGIAATFEMPLFWQGLVAEARYIQPIEESLDFKQGGVFYEQRLQNGFDRVMLHQYLRFNQVDTHTAIGRLYPDVYGGFFEGQFPLGSHQFSTTFGYFKNDENNLTDYHPLLLGYRYQVPQQDIQLAVKVGEFLDGDKGFKIESRFMFADTDVNLFFQKTKHDNQQAQDYIGLEIALPLTPRRSYTNSWLQVKGNEEYKQSFMTRINHNQNLVAGSAQNARLFDVPYNMDDKLFNRDRLSRSYVLQHMSRIQQIFQSEINP